MNCEFFFLAYSKDNELTKYYVNGHLKPKTLLSNIDLDNCLDKEYNTNVSDENLRKLYISRINSIHIYFAPQLTNISLLDKTIHDIEHQTTILNKNKIYFLKRVYDTINITQLDKYKYIQTPTDLLIRINESIRFCIIGLDWILENHTQLLLKDYERLKQKKTFLSLTLTDTTKLKDVIRLLKERDKDSYLLFDIDSDITDLLINLNYLKYNRLIHGDICEVSDALYKYYNEKEKIGQFIYNEFNIEFNNFK